MRGKARISEIILPSLLFLGGNMKESTFQHNLMVELEQRFPGAIVTKIEPVSIQGIPDILVLYRKRWAMLECKKSEDADHQPNQDYYVELLNNMSFAAFIYPENREDVLNDLEQTFFTGRKSCVSKS